MIMREFLTLVVGIRGVWWEGIVWRLLKVIKKGYQGLDMRAVP